MLLILKGWKLPNETCDQNDVERSELYICEWAKQNGFE